MMVKCVNCGKEFEAKRSDAKYCSAKCRQQAKRGSFAVKQCPMCGKEFKGPNHQKYCSDDCAEWAQRLMEFHNNSSRFDDLDFFEDADEWDSLG